MTRWARVRVLLDEQLPRPLAQEFVGHDVRTVQAQGWAGLLNGELLARTSADGFDAFVTSDQNLEFQQNVTRLPFCIIVLKARSNDFDDLRPLIPSVLAAIDSAEPGQVVHVST